MGVTRQRRQRSRGIKTATGVGVDSSGGPLIDPTENVKALAQASAERQDDLRDLNDRRIDAEIRVLTVRIESQEKMAIMRAMYEEKLSNAEAKRIDAIRAVDVNAVAVANQKSADQATVLANQVVASADALRGLVATTATAQQQAYQQNTGALSDRITTIEKAQYEEKGKQGVVDPMQAAMFEELKNLRSIATSNAGQSTGARNLWALIVGAAILLFGLITTAIAVITFVALRK